MKHDENHKRRRSIRLSHYDYGRAGAYFVTICVQDRVSLFGRIVGSDLYLNELGRLVSSEWRRTPVVRPNVELDEYVIMPNHLHGIINILESRRGVLPYAPTMRRSPHRASGLSSAVSKQRQRSVSTKFGKRPVLPYATGLIRACHSKRE